MNEKTKYAFNNPKWGVLNCDIDTIKAKLNELDFNAIFLDLEVEYITDTGKVHLKFNDKDHPISIMQGGADEFDLIQKTLAIGKEYFDEHKDKVMELICYIARFKNVETLHLDSPFITREVLDALKMNPHLKEIKLGTREKPFTLTREIYELFKDSSIEVIYTDAVSNDLKDNFDSLIGYNSKRPLIGNKNYEDLRGLHAWFVLMPLKPDEYENLKYLPDDIKVKFSNSSSVTYKDGLEIIRALNKLGKKPKVSINVDNETKNSLNSVLFDYLDEIKDMDITIVYNQDEVPLSKYVEYEKRLMDLVAPAINLSPFERYLYAYNVVKKFKPYKENEQDTSTARNLYDIMDNEYMVCVGYSVMLGDLLTKLGINSRDYFVSVDTGFDKIEPEAMTHGDEVKLDLNGHVRRIVSLVDEKHGINGIFFADPTWDNIMDADAYNHALMNIDEYLGMPRYTRFQFFGVTELLFSHDLEEFYQKVNIILDRKAPKTPTEEEIDDLYRDVSTQFKQIGVQVPSVEKEYKKETQLINDLVAFIGTIDEAKKQELMAKYPKLNIYSSTYTFKEIQDMLLTLGEYVVEKANTIIPGNIVREGIKTIYSKCYGTKDEELDGVIDKIMEYNSVRQRSKFPTRYKITKDEKKIPIFNEKNKFDLEGTKTM